MPQKPNPNHQQTAQFYLELPFQESLTTEYPADVEIQHAYDDPAASSKGLSSEQVSALAQDALEDAGRSDQNYASPSGNQPPHPAQ